jgi:hypothetical protein
MGDDRWRNTPFNVQAQDDRQDDRAEYRPLRRPPTEPYETRRARWIAEGFCPMPGCPGELDEAKFCAMCGWSLEAELVRLPPRLEPDDVAERFPPELLDEYAPAQLDEPPIAEAGSLEDSLTRKGKGSSS